MRLRHVVSALFVTAALGISSLASAADIPVKAQPVVADWTGAYFGVHVGAGSSTIESALDFGGFPFPISSHGLNGMVAGVQGGYNFQAGWAVFGVESSFSWSDIRGTAPCLLLFNCNTH